MTKKTIIVGSNDMAIIPALFKSLGAGSKTDFSIVTASDANHLLTILHTVKPDIVILRFQDTSVFNPTLCEKLVDIPLLLLTRKNEEIPTLCADNHILFTAHIEDCGQPDFLKEKVNAIFHVLETRADDTYTDQTELRKYILELDRKNKILQRVKQSLEKHVDIVNQVTKKELRSLLYSINRTLSESRHPDHLRHFLDNQEFISFLKNQFPKLTSDDLKYCYYLRLNMSNREISDQLGISPESVRTHKYRLKKKMNLSRHTELHYFIQSFESSIFVSELSVA